jgi:hypothetical protein
MYVYLHTHILVCIYKYIQDKQRTWKEKKRAKRVYKKNKKRNKRGEYDPPEQVEVIPLEIIEPNYPGPYAYVDDAYTPIPPLPYEEERYEAESYEVASVPLSLSNQQCSAACEKKDFECQFALMCEVENECRESNPRSRADPVCQDCKVCVRVWFHLYMLAFSFIYICSLILSISHKALQQAQEKKEQIPFACNICASSVEDCRVCRKLDNGGVC